MCLKNECHFTFKIYLQGSILFGQSTSWRATHGQSSLNFESNYKINRYLFVNQLTLLILIIQVKMKTFLS